MKYFTIKELTSSATAKKLKIDNTPSKEVIEHLKELIEFLDPLREQGGSAIKITSGYRSEILNKAVGGSPTSVHKIGYAVDMIPVNGKMDEFIQFITDYLKDKQYDQCIVEQSGKTRGVHLSLYNNSGKQRKTLFCLYK